MRLNKITSLQYATLTFFLANSFLMNIGYHTIIQISKNDSLFSIFIGGIFIVLYALFIFYLRNQENENIIVTLKNKFPLSVRIFLSIILFIVIGISSIFSLSTLVNFLHYYVVKEVDSFWITITLVFTILYIVNKGLYTITKISEIFFYLYFLLFGFGMIGLIKYIDLSNLKPFFTTPIKSYQTSSLIYFITSLLPLFLLLIIPKKEMEINKKGKKLPLFFLFLSILFTLIQCMMIFSVLGIELASIYQNADMIMYKKISLLNLLERVETILAFLNILNSLFILLVGIYFLKELIKENIFTKKEHITLALIGILLIILSHILPTSQTIYFIINMIIFLIVPLILLGYYHDKHSH